MVQPYQVNTATLDLLGSGYGFPLASSVPNTSAFPVMSCVCMLCIECVCVCVCVVCLCVCMHVFVCVHMCLLAGHIIYILEQLSVPKAVMYMIYCGEKLLYFCCCSKQP